MQVINLSNPGANPVDGDLIRIEYGNGATEEKHYCSPPADPGPTPDPVPRSVTMRQARLALLGAGKLALVQPAINALAEPQKSAAQIEWDYSNEVHRQQPFVLQMGAALGLDSAALDSLFIAAAKL